MPEATRSLPERTHRLCRRSYGGRATPRPTRRRDTAIPTSAPRSPLEQPRGPGMGRTLPEARTQCRGHRRWPVGPCFALVAWKRAGMGPRQQFLRRTAPAVGRSQMVREAAEQPRPLSLDDGAGGPQTTPAAEEAREREAGKVHVRTRTARFTARWRSTDLRTAEPAKARRRIAAAHTNWATSVDSAIAEVLERPPVMTSRTASK